jgi:hypothetical protein
MEENGRSDETYDAGDAADDDRHDLFEAVADPEDIEHRDRREKTDQVAKKDDENAHVEKHGPEDELLATKQLARVGAPRIGLPVVTYDPCLSG